MTIRCKVCNQINGDKFQKTCSYKCRGIYLQSPDGIKEVAKTLSKIRAERKRTNKAKAKGLQHWLKVTQVVFNRYIRERDKGLGCISCGKHAHMMGGSGLGGVFDAGHYKSVGSSPELRFETKNVNGQCRDCNGFKGGMPKEYAKGIVARYGQDRLEWLEGHHEAKHYTIEDLADMRKELNKKIRNLADVSGGE